jgi:hypothetical protein
VSTVVFARLDDVLRAADRVGRIGGDDLAGDQPVEQHADSGEVLLDRRLLEILAERLDKTLREFTRWATPICFPTWL